MIKDPFVKYGQNQRNIFGSKLFFWVVLDMGLPGVEEFGYFFAGHISFRNIPKGFFSYLQ